MAKANIEDYYPLTPLQQGMLFHRLSEPGSGLYHDQILLDLGTSPDFELVQRAIDFLVARHAVLRASFVWEDVKEPIQVVRESIPSVATRRDWTGLAAVDAESRLEAFRREDAENEFDLSEAPLLRFSIFEIVGGARLLFSYSHLLLDGGSATLLLKEFSAVYDGLRSGRSPDLARPVSYREYVKWLRRQDRSAAEGFWKRYLEGFDTPCLLKADGLGSGERTGEGESRRRRDAVLDAPLASSLARFARAARVTPSTLFQAAWGLLLQLHTGEGDVSFGVVVSNVPPELGDPRSSIGFFINTLPARVRSDGASRVSDWLQGIQREMAGIQRHSYASLADIQEWAAPKGRRQLFNTLFLFENSLAQEESAEGSAPRDVPYYSKNNYPAALYVYPGRETLLRLEYSSAEFSDEFASRLLRRYRVILESLSENAARAVGEVEFTTSEERSQLLWDFNATERDYPLEKSLSRLFEEQAARTPEALALVFESRAFSYRELDGLANALARRLCAAGLGRGALAGILCRRSPEMLVALLATLKAGAAYLPLDPAYPVARLQQTLEDSGARALLVLGADLEGLEFGGATALLDGVLEEPLVAAAPGSGAEPSDLAYVIYTSGSTGRPKGVMVEHRNVANFVLGTRERLGFEPGDRFLCATTMGFDIFVLETLIPLLSGMTVVLANDDQAAEPELLLDLIRASGATVAQATPSRLRMLTATAGWADALSGVKLLLVGGEAFPPDLLRLLRPQLRARIYNLYGPTETTVWSTVQELTHRNDVDIGKPLPNVRARVVGPSGRLCPIGIAGELLLGGGGVARGYLNRSDLTAERFARSEWDVGELLYRTGDLARWTASGDLECLGRLDHQVKIRGHRLELGEIEMALEAIPGVEQAVAIAREDGGLGESLRAYIVGAEAPCEAELRAALLRALPAYMVPSAFVRMDALPLTSSGKVDRKSLPEPEGSLGAAAEYEAPRDAREEALARIWATALGAKRVGIWDDFFALGGHSLKAVSVVSRIRKELGVAAKLGDLFDFPRLADLAATLAGRAPRSLPPLLPAARRGRYPATSQQRRLYVLQQMAPGGLAYNVPLAFALPAETPVARVRDAAAAVVARHEILRARFELADGELTQIVEDLPFAIEVEEGEGDAAGSGAEDFWRAFDLGRAPLLRVKLLRSGSEGAVLWVDLHHIVTDGVSVGLLIRDFGRALAGEPLGPAPLQYGDYALWQRSEEARSALERQGEYWRTRFAVLPPACEIPTDFPRSRPRDLSGARLEFPLGEPATRALRALCRESGATLHMALLACYGLVLSRLCGQEDVVVGNAASGRDHPDLEGIMGMFVNTLPMRLKPAGELSFAAYLRDVRRACLEALENQQYPYEELVESLELDRDTSRNPLFDTMLVVQNFEAGAPAGSLAPQRIPLQGTASKFDLTIAGWESERDLLLDFEYATGLFREATVSRIAGYLRRAVESAARDPGQKLAEIEILSDEERGLLLRGFNATEVSYPLETSVAQRFEEQAARAPLDPALRFRGRVFAYGELDGLSNALAQRLRSLGAAQGEVIGILSPRSAEMVVALLATLKSGAAYLPLDATWPRERLEYMLEDSGARALLTLGSAGEGLRFAGETLPLEGVLEAVGVASPPSKGPRAEDLAYVIYTSGSTGWPKGVMVEHRNLANFVLGTRDRIGFESSDRFLCATTMSFDIFALEMLLPLLCGSRVELADDAQAREPRLLLDLIRESEVTVAQATPSRLRMLCASEGWSASLAGLSRLLVGGEAFPADLLEQLRGQLKARIYNMYGPTETTVWSTVQELTRRERVDIGRPLANTVARVLDAQGRLCPIGVTGELCIGGGGVARGYLNRAELTAERFIASAFDKGGRLYRTGDLARWTAEGDLECLGRLDHQVKIRGHRVELGEVEAAIQAIEGIEGAAVAMRSVAGEPALVGYYTLKPGAQLTRAALLEQLSARLPSYMAPSFLTPVASLPLTANGKVDRSALPDPGQADLDNIPRRLPATPTEQALAAIWREVLAVEDVAADMSFFRLGGHSLKAMALASKMRRRLEVELTLQDIFEHTTVESMARIIDGKMRSRLAEIEPAPRSARYPLSSQQRRIYLLQQFDLSGVTYNMPELIELPGEIPLLQLQSALDALLLRHEGLRASFELEDGELAQTIHERVKCPVDREIISEAALDGIASDFVRAFDLAKPPLLRVKLIGTDANRWFLAIDIHHIVSDGLSNTLLLRDLTRMLSGEILPALTLQYKDFSTWQQIGPGAILAKRHEAFWKKHFEGYAPTGFELPTDFPRTQRSGKALSLDLFLPLQHAQEIRALLEKSRATLFMALHACMGILVSRLRKTDDVVIGSPVSGRDHEALQNVCGLFMNTIAIRSRPVADKTFLQYLDEIKADLLDAMQNQYYPFEELLESLPIKRDTTRNPLFDVFLNALNYQDWDALPAAGRTTRNLGRQAKFDWEIYSVEREKSIELRIVYDGGLYKPERMEITRAQIASLLHQIVRDPTRKIGDFSLYNESPARSDLPISERSDELWKGSVVDLFEARANAEPARAAIEQEGEAMTYGQLRESSDRVAAALAASGAVRGDVVALYGRMCPELVSSILGVWKSGAATLLLDPELPALRLQTLCEEANAKALVRMPGASSEVVESLGVIEIDPINFDAVAAEKRPWQMGALAGSDLAYVISTSGTTGKPKLVATQHAPLAKFIVWQAERFKLSSRHKFSVLSGIGHDPVMRDLFTALSVGGCVCMPWGNGGRDLNSLPGWIAERRIGVCHLTPSLWRGISSSAGADARFDSIEYLFFGGEALSPADIEATRALAPNARAINFYGATETPQAASFWECAPERPAAARISIGKGRTGARLRVVSDRLSDCGIGEIGEIGIAGDCLSMGYVNDADLTARKFVNQSASGCRMYLTGDAGRLGLDGNIEVLGRLDRQTKLRGHRIELAEIEELMRSFEGIQSATAIAMKTDKAEYVAAFYTEKSPVDKARLRDMLRESLPEYMVPRTCAPLEAFPLTPNGKLDHGALMQLASAPGSTELSRVAPETETEALLARVWAEALGLPQESISATANFFDLGGDSLLMLRVVARSKALGLSILFSELVQYPTIRELARRDLRSSQPTDERKVAGSFEVNPMQSFFLNKNSHPARYALVARFNLLADVSIERLRQAASFLLDHHESLRSRFERREDRWIGIIPKAIEFGIEEIVTEERLDHADVATQERLLLDKWHSYRDRLDFRKGKNLIMTLYQRGERAPRQLHVFVHHLAADVESMKIVFEDLFQLCRSSLIGQPLSLPVRATAYRKAMGAIAEACESAKLNDELAFWRNVPWEKMRRFPLDKPEGARDNTYASARRMTAFVEEQTTSALLECLPKVNATMVDAIAAALATAIAEHCDSDWVQMITAKAGGLLNAYCRQLDVARLVGWFSGGSKLVLSRPMGADPLERLLFAKEQVAAIPGYGLGFDMLMNCSARSDVREQLRSVANRDIFFNYFGRAPATEERSPFFERIPDRDDEPYHHESYRAEREFLLILQFRIAGNRLEMACDYSVSLHDEATIDRFLGRIGSELIAIGEACRETTRSSELEGAPGGR